MVRSLALAARNAAAGNPRITAPTIKHNPTVSIPLVNTTQLTIVGSTAIDTTTPLWPGQAAHLRMTCGTSTAYRTYTPASPWDLSNSYLRVTTRLTDLSHTAGWTFRLADSATAYNAGNYVEYLAIAHAGAQTTTANWLPTGTWVREAVDPALMTVTGTGLTTWASVGYVAFGGRSTTATVTVDIAKFEIVPKSSAKAKCVIWHDDSVLTGATGVASRMATYGFPWTEATEWEMVGQSLIITNSDVTGYVAAGVQFGSHATTTAEHVQDEPPSLFNQAYRNKIGERRLRGLTGAKGGHDFAWWGGQSAATVYLDAFKACYRSGRYNTSTMQYPEQLPPAEPHLYKALLVATTDTLAAVWQPYLNAAIACKGLATFVFHQDLGATGGNAALITEFNSMLTWLDANRASIDVVTIDTALASST